MPVAELAEALLADRSLRERYLADPAGVLTDHGVGHADLPALAALVGLRSRGWPAAERRAFQALVFLAFATDEEDGNRSDDP